MITKNYNINQVLRCVLLLLVTTIWSTGHVLADGSKDLYPSGATGGRAFLLASTTGADCAIAPVEITCDDECYMDVEGSGFQWSYAAGEAPSDPVVQTFNQPVTNGGFVLDIYELDNSFNMEINGVPLYSEELEFQRAGGLTQNVRFKNGGIWEDGVIPNIWKINQDMILDDTDRFNNPVPAVRVVIDPLGNVSLFGKRADNASLEPLEVFDPNTGVTTVLNTVHWISDPDVAQENIINVTQNVVSVTRIKGFGYGLNVKECETCTIEKDGVFNDENGDDWAQVGETITYTFDVINAGDMDIADVEIVDPLFGFNITLDENTHQPLPAEVTMTGDLNSNGILNRNETWTFTVSYTVTSNDIFTNKGVYNRATVNGVGRVSETSSSTRVVSEESVDPTPYDSTWEGWDPNRPFHTFVPLKGNSLLITNPMIYQRMKN